MKAQPFVLTPNDYVPALQVPGSLRPARPHFSADVS